jgi:TolB-like protein
MSRTSAILTIALVLSLPALCARPAAAEGRAGGKAPAVAILEIANAGMEPRLDYLAGIVQGILAFDLGSRPDLALVDRRNLDAVLKEKELSLSALGQDAGAAAEAGRLAGADWLVSGEYVFLGSDVLLTLSLTDAATAKRTVFRDRGSTENLVHSLAEKLVQRLTGASASFADAGRSRSLVSLRDETPGSIALYSILIRAEVFVDGQFYAYTTGDPTVPLDIEKLSPGKHRLRVHLNNDFGVIKLPEVSFHDWEAEVEVEPAKRLTVRDETRHFNETLYHLIALGGDGSKPKIPAKAGDALDPKLSFVKELSFQDRTGAEVRVRVEAKPRQAGDSITLDLALSVAAGMAAPATALLSLPLPREDYSTNSGEATAGIVKLSASAECYYSSYWDFDWRLDRTDIEQNMFRD